MQTLLFFRVSYVSYCKSYELWYISFYIVLVSVRPSMNQNSVGILGHRISRRKGIPASYSGSIKCTNCPKDVTLICASCKEKCHTPLHIKDKLRHQSPFVRNCRWWSGVTLSIIYQSSFPPIEPSQWHLHCIYVQDLLLVHLFLLSTKLKYFSLDINQPINQWIKVALNMKLCHNIYFLYVFV